MPPYKVTLTRTTWEYATIYVNMPTPEEAEARAMEVATKGHQAVSWEGGDDYEPDTTRAINCEPVEGT